MKRNTLIDPEERERRLKELANESDRGRQRHMAYGLANEILLADKRRRNPPAPKPKPPTPTPPRPGPWQPLESLGELLKRKNGGSR